MNEDYLANLFANQYDRVLKQVMLSLFGLLVSVVLGYFYRESLKNPSVKKENISGLLFLALAFFFIFVMGTTEAAFKSGHLSVLISGVVNIFLILSLPFFSKGVTPLDKLATHPVWYFVAGQFALVYGLSMLFPQKFGIDIVLSSLTLMIFGVFLVSFFIRTQLRFIGIIVGLAIASMIILQILAEANVSGGKFLDINIAVLYPSLFLSMIVLVVTFNWVNEIRFKQLANIYTEGVDKELIDRFLSKQITKKELTDDWSKDITSNQLESVIEEMIMVAEKQNQNLALLLTIASRNSRNNTGFYVNGTISKDDYNRERNQITAGILHLVDEL
ncbi:MAG: hypothetical protein DHS20C18_11080 [Saprospiraceae bacterium]|nr:MAG: hypothetical protein DHS20C18_11080 [Saprospiraceae bacterium]